MRRKKERRHRLDGKAKVRFALDIPKPEPTAKKDALLSPPFQGMPSLLERLYEDISTELPELVDLNLPSPMAQDLSRSP